MANDQYLFAGKLCLARLGLSSCFALLNELTRNAGQLAIALGGEGGRTYREHFLKLKFGLDAHGGVFGGLASGGGSFYRLQLAHLHLQAFFLGDGLQAVNTLLVEQASATSGSSTNSRADSNGLAIALGQSANGRTSQTAYNAAAHAADPAVVLGDGTINRGAATQAHSNGNSQRSRTHHTGAKHSSPLHFFGPLSGLNPAGELHRKAR